MDDAARRALVEAIHDTPTMVVLAVAGGGNLVITDLLGVPGASRTVLEARVPYAATALGDLVGPDMDAGAVSEEMAEAMALACLQRAQELAPNHGDVVGLAVTAALVTDRAKRGDHRAHIAVAHPRAEPTVEAHFVPLAKGELDRAGEDRLVADLALGHLATACGLPPTPAN